MIRLPIAHHDGNYIVDAAGLAACGAKTGSRCTYTDNPNGSTADIAGVLSANRRVLGLMPHPERAADPALGIADGAALFGGILQAAGRRLNRQLERSRDAGSTLRP